MSVASESDTFGRPSDEEIAHGLEYMFIISEEIDFGGTIWRYPDMICWDFHSEPKESPYARIDQDQKSQLVFTTLTGEEVLRIRRSPELRDTHYIFRKDDFVGAIKLTTSLRNKFSISLEGCPVWTFHLPHFKTLFRAESADGRRIWAKVWKRKQQLRLLVPSELRAETRGEQNPQNFALLPALAFIHREWWCSG